MRGLPSHLRFRLPRGGRFRLGLALVLAAAALPVGPRLMAAFYRPPLPVGVPAVGSTLPSGLHTTPPSEGLRPDPIDFSTEELRSLNRRFGVHGPQPPLAQLFTAGLDNLVPLRSHTLGRIEELRPVILHQADRHQINPMLLAAVLFDELQHAKPGENTPIAAGSGLFSTHGPAQLSLGELVKQGLLSPDASPDEVQLARLELLDPDRSVEILATKFVRLSEALGLPRQRILMASTSPRDAKGLATLAYLHNGKLDYPGRVLRYMQDPELHALIYSNRNRLTSPLI